LSFADGIFVLERLVLGEDLLLATFRVDVDVKVPRGCCCCCSRCCSASVDDDDDDTRRGAALSVLLLLVRRLFVLCDDKDALDFFFGLLSGIVVEILRLLELLPLLCFRFRMVGSETNAVCVDFAVAVDRIRDFCVLRFDDPLLLLLVLVLVLEEPRTTTAVLFGLRFSRPLLRPKAVGAVAVEP